MSADSATKTLQLLSKRGVLRPCELAELGIPRAVVWRLWRQGRVERSGRGLYRASGASVTEHRSLAEVGKRAPQGVLCLLSALQFHGIGTQAPGEVWLALARGAWKPRIEWPPLRVVRLTGTAFTALAERHVVEGVTVQVYSPAKTVADCFRFRNRIGLDVAMEVLRDVWHSHRCTMDQLWEAARVCRVATVMRPYLESLT